MKLKYDNSNIYIIRADKKDLSEILDLQYLAYQKVGYKIFDEKQVT